MATSGVLRQAVQDRILVALAGTLGSYKCLLCNKVLSGETPALQHLSGSEHRNEGSRIILSNPRDSRASLRMLVPPRLLRAAEEGVVRGFRCTVCAKDLTGVDPLVDHLSGSNHAKKVAASSGATAGHLGTMSRAVLQTDSSGPIRCDPCGITCTGLESYNEHIRGQKHKKKVGGVVSVDDGSKQFKCRACDITCTGRESYDDHVRGQKHQKKVCGYKRDQEGVNQIECALCGISCPGLEGYEEHKRGQKHQKKVLASRMPLPFMPEPLPSLDNNEKMETFASEGPYPVTSNPRGFVYIFNYKFKGKPNERYGAEKDSVNLRETFRDLGYQVFLKENLGGRQTKDELDAIRQNNELWQVDSLIIFFLSHGSSPYLFEAEDGEELNLRSLRLKFADSKFPQMKGKPKILFANFCRGDRFQKRIETDSVVEPPRDMITIHAAIEGVKVPRSPEFGTFFIRNLCEVLRKYSRTKSLREIYILLDRETLANGGTQPMSEDYVFRHFYF